MKIMVDMLVLLPSSAGKKQIDQLTIWFYMACSREGEKRVQDKQARRRRKSKKCGCKARIVFKFDSDRG